MSEKHEMPDTRQPGAEENEAERISAADSRLHSDTVNTLILAAVILFFGSVFLALTNYQDFSEKKPLTLKSFLSGQYLSDVEKRFNSSLPLQDYIHNANVFLSSCFGVDADGEYIDIAAKRAADDPYNIEDTNMFVPITDSYSPEDNSEPDAPATGKGGDEPVETTDDGKNKELSGITMRVTTTSADSSSSSGSTTTTNNNPPGATTTTTIPPETTTPTETTPSETEPTDTEPPVTEPPEPVTDSSSDSSETPAESSENA